MNTIKNGTQSNDDKQNNKNDKHHIRDRDRG